MIPDIRKRWKQLEIYYKQHPYVTPGEYQRNYFNDIPYLLSQLDERDKRIRELEDAFICECGDHFECPGCGKGQPEANHE